MESGKLHFGQGIFYRGQVGSRAKSLLSILERFLRVSLERSKISSKVVLFSQLISLGGHLFLQWNSRISGDSLLDKVGTRILLQSQQNRTPLQCKSSSKSINQLIKSVMTQNIGKRQAILNWLKATPFFCKMGISSLEQLGKPAQLARVLALFDSIFENQKKLNLEILSQHCQQMGVTLQRQVQLLLRGKHSNQSSRLKLGELILQLSVMSQVRQQSIKGLLSLTQNDKLILKSIISPDQPHQQYVQEQNYEHDQLSQENCQLRAQLVEARQQCRVKQELISSLGAQLSHFRCLVGSLNEQLEHQDHSNHLHTQEISQLSQQLIHLKQSLLKQKQQRAKLQKANQELLAKLRAKQEKQAQTIRFEKRPLVTSVFNEQTNPLSKNVARLLQSQTLALIDYHQKFRDKVGNLLARRIM